MLGLNGDLCSDIEEKNRSFNDVDCLAGSSYPVNWDMQLTTSIQIIGHSHAGLNIIMSATLLPYSEEDGSRNLRAPISNSSPEWQN
jgi:hypothetical protein